MVLNFIQSIGQEKKWEEFIAGPAAEANRYGQAAADQLGPIHNITGLAHDMYGRARGLVGDISTQEVADVNQRFNQLGASGQANLAARGIGGSTVAPSVAYANERNRSDELRRVNDARMMRLLGVESTFGGGEIAANLGASNARANFNQNRVLFPPQGVTPFTPAPR